MKFSKLLVQTIGWGALASLRRVAATGLIRQLIQESIRRKLQKTPFRILLSPMAVRGYNMLTTIAKISVRPASARFPLSATPEAIVYPKNRRLLRGAAVGFVAAAMAGICTVYYLRKK